MPAKQRVHFTLTMFDYEERGYPQKFNELLQDGTLRYWVAGFETCPNTGKQHLQCHLQFWSKKTWYAVANIFSPSHVEFSESPSDSIPYCKKTGQFQEGGNYTLPAARADINQVRTWFSEGKDMNYVIDNASNMQQVRFAEAYRAHHQIPRSSALPKHNIWLYGLPGVGKTYRAYQLARERYPDSDIYVMGQDHKSWDGYHGQKCVIIDDIRSDFNFAYLLRILDRYPFRVRRLYGFAELVADMIIVTCPQRPEILYRQQQSDENMLQLTRRLVVVDEVRGNTIPGPHM